MKCHLFSINSILRNFNICENKIISQKTEHNYLLYIILHFMINYDLKTIVQWHVLPFFKFPIVLHLK